MCQIIKMCMYLKDRVNQPCPMKTGTIAGMYEAFIMISDYITIGFVCVWCMHTCVWDMCVFLQLCMYKQHEICISLHVQTVSQDCVS
ncbi:hypothetical protein GDO86_017326 [Hymenochirus boettgeri]|uniref:Uncharacterized protein n=1 Tax=Hymenochirus boettgeri TaxID=247094 RepID=A0A8T2ILZ8_9PIPI|nr:hypothetical protein GDO86_017326 [Hymenochirus boettgeri]